MRLLYLLAFLFVFVLVMYSGEAESQAGVTEEQQNKANRACHPWRLSVMYRLNGALRMKCTDGSDWRWDKGDWVLVNFALAP